MTTTFSKTSGGELDPIAAFTRSTGTPSCALRSTTPWSPKVVTGSPVFASSATRLKPGVTVKMRSSFLPSALGRPRPERHAASRIPPRCATCAIAFVEVPRPFRRARHRIRRHHPARRARREVERAVHHDRRALVARLRRDAEVVRPPFPDDLDFAEGVSIEEVERRVPAVAEIAAVAAPLGEASSGGAGGACWADAIAHSAMVRATVKRAQFSRQHHPGALTHGKLGNFSVDLL